jgi:hypothetical protein
MAHELLQVGNICYASDSGIIKTSKGDVSISGVSAYLSKNGDVIVEGIIKLVDTDKVNNSDIQFQDFNGWSINGVSFSIFNEQSTPDIHYVAFKAKGHKLICKHGEISNTDNVKIFNIVTGIKFAGAHHIDGLSEFAVKFNHSELKDLLLIKSNISQVPNSVGYFETSDIFSNYATTWVDRFNNLLLLLRFAASNMINFPLIYISKSEGNELIEITSYIKDGGQGSSIFYLDYPGELKKIVDSTYGNLVALRHVLDLDKLILYYIMMKNTIFVDNKYLLGCVFMEGLKYSFANNVKHYTPYKNGFINPAKSKNEKFTFEELITEIYQTYKITKDDKSFIKYRNEVIHQGAISSISFETLLAKKAELEALIEHLLLNILEYNGLYWDRSSKSWVNYKSLTV